MSDITIRDLPETTRDALRLRAEHNGRTPEEEVRAIIQAVLAPATAEGLADELAKLGRAFGITDEFENLRDRSASRVVSFE